MSEKASRRKMVGEGHRGDVRSLTRSVSSLTASDNVM